MPPKFISQAASFIVRKPLIASSTMAAAITAPFFASNEDRGYFRSALITTPVIFAASAYMPNFGSGIRGMKNTVASSNQAINAAVDPDLTNLTYKKLGSLFRDKSVPSNTLDKALATYLTQEHKIKTYDKERKVLNRYFHGNFVKTEKLMSDIADASNPKRQLEALAKAEAIENLHNTKGRLLSNALHSARRASLTPAEWAEEGTNTLGLLDNEAMMSMYKKYESRDPFVRTLANRLRKVKTLNDTGLEIAAATVTPMSVKTAMLDASDAYYPVEQAFKSQRPDVMKNLQAALDKGMISRAEITAESVTSGEIGRVMNVRVFRKGNTKGLLIPIVDPTTGSVRLPNAVGVGNKVIGPDLQARYIDEWMSKLLLENGSSFTDEQLEKEIAGHAYYMAGDPLDSHRMYELASKSEGGDAIMSPQAIKTRSHSTGFTQLPFYKNERGDRVSALELEPARQNALLREVMNTGNYVPIGSESGVSELRFQERAAANLSPFGAASAEKQDPFWRSITKELSLKTREGLSEDARLKWHSTAWESITGSPTMPSINLNVASISPQDRMFFADLPSTKQEFEGSFGNIMDTLKNRGMSRADAIATFEELHEVYTKGQQGMFNSLGRMGETGYLINDELAKNLYVEGRVKYRVDRLVRESGTLGVNDVLGYTGAEAVTPDFPGTIESIAKAEDGSGFYINMLHEHAMQGAKLDVNGIKGMVPLTIDQEEFTRTRGFLNRFYARTKQRSFISEAVNTFAPMEYFANKVDPSLAYLGISGDLLNRIGPSAAKDEYLAAMGEHGISFVSGQIVIDAAKNPTNDSEAAARLIKLSQINEEFFDKAGQAIRTAGTFSHDPVLGGFLQAGGNLGDYYLKNFLPSVTFAWNHSKINLPKFATITHDIESYLTSSQNFAALKEIQGRSLTLTGGDANKGVDFLDYVIKGNYDKPAGIIVPLDKALSSPESLAKPSNRAGSIFDPSIAAYKEMFHVDLGEGGKYRYLPVPGTKTYGAEASMYGEGSYAVHDFQKDFVDVFKSRNSPEARDRAAETLINTYKGEFGTGKQSVFRPKKYDPLGMPGFLSTSAESADPFVARVGPDWVARMHDKSMRDALQKGDSVYGMLLRQPTQETLHLRYVMDPKMKGTYDVAVDELISRAHSGDQDQDPIINLMWKKGSEAEQEAIEAINSDKQWGMLAGWKEIKGNQEIAREVSADLKGLRGRTVNYAKAVAERTEVAVKRTAAASIGKYSNVLTGIMEQMTRSTEILRQPELSQRLKVAMFDTIRQAPINARKAHNAFDLETAEKLVGKLSSGLRAPNDELAASSLHEAMLSLSSTLSSGGKTGSEYKYWAGQGLEDLKMFASNRNERAAIMSKILTSGNTEYAVENLEQGFAAGIEEVRGVAHGGRMATAQASKLGQISEFLVDAARGARSKASGVVGKELMQHGKSLAIGLGALAAIGIAMTPRTAPAASFNNISSNRHRPEDRVGISDHIPGESMAGQMAPSNPPRRMQAGPSGVRTAVVAPMSRTSDVTVNMKATDKDRVAETLRQVAGIPSTDDTNVTINYRNKTKISSLRMQDKIRDILG